MTSSADAPACPHRTAGPRAFSLTSRIAQCDSGIGCGCSGQPRPPASWRAEPQPADSVVTFPGLGRRAGSGPLDDPGPASPAVRELVPGFGARPGCTPRDVDGTGASRPGSSPLVSRDPRPAISVTAKRAMGLCGMHDGRGTGATAINEDPVRGVTGCWRCARPSGMRSGVNCLMAGNGAGSGVRSRSPKAHRKRRPCTACPG
jgi:hypothetical protein